MMRKRRLIWGGVLILFSVLFFVALSAGYVNTLFDYRTFSGLSGSDKFGVSTTNSVGIFGMVVSYWGYAIFGNYFVYLVNSILLLVGITLFIPEKRFFLLTKLFSFFVLSLFLYFFCAQLALFSTPVGMIADNYLVLLAQIFGETGSAIVTFFLLFFFLVVFVELKKICDFLGFTSKMAFKVYKGSEHAYQEAKKISWRSWAVFNFYEKRILPFVQKRIAIISSKKANEKEDFELSEQNISEIEEDFSEDESIFKIKENKQDIKIAEKLVPHRTFPELKQTQAVSDDEKFVLPSMERFLNKLPVNTAKDGAKLKRRAEKISSILEKKLAEFGVEAEVVGVSYGPVITQFEMKPSPGVKVSRFVALQDDLSLALKARSLRVQAPIPGEDKIGIEIPNQEMELISLRKVLDGYREDKFLPMALGVDIAGNPVIADLAKTPHLLIAGATGAGKSVCVNTLINSLLFYLTPDELRMVMIDPKKIELSGYADIPHLIQEIVTLPEDSLAALNWATKEMDDRYSLLQKYGVRDLRSFNKVVEALDQKNVLEEEKVEKLPYIVVVVDEFADLIMTAGKEIEKPITRLAQMGRAVGFHLILATQRPSTQVITGVIKANFPSRIAFRVSSKIDSRVILDVNGAEKLLGRGDMLFLAPGKSDVIRVHGAYISDKEIEGVVQHLRTQPKPKKDFVLFSDEQESVSGGFDSEDELFVDAAKFVVDSKTASVSMLQRHFKIGYARAGRLVDLLEQAGIVGPHLGSKPREVRATEEELKIYGYV